MQDNQENSVNYIQPADPELQDKQSMLVDEILSRLPTMQQTRVRIDEQSGEIVIPGLNQDSASDARVLDIGGRILMNGDLNADALIVLFAIIKMKEWERIEIRGNEAFCHEVSCRAVDRELQLADEGLRDYVSARMKSERIRESLVAGFVYLLVIVIGLVVPFLMIFGLSDTLLPLLEKNALYALPLLAAIVVVLRLMVRWITR